MKIFKDNKKVAIIDEQSAKLVESNSTFEELFNKLKSEGLPIGVPGKGYSEEFIVDSIEYIDISSDSLGLLEMILEDYGYTSKFEND